MKILCVADTVDPLIYSPNAKKRFDGKTVGFEDWKGPTYDHVLQVGLKIYF